MTADAMHRHSRPLAGARILIVTHFGAEVEGSRRACTAILEATVPAIVAAGGEAYVAPIRADDHAREANWLRSLGGELVWAPLRPRYNPFYFGRLRRAIDDLQPHLVHAQFIPADLYGAAAALTARCRPAVLVTAHNLYHTLRTWRYLLPVYRWMVRRGVRFTGVSQAVADSISGPLGVGSDRIEVVLNPRQALAPISPKERAQSKRALGLDPDALVIGFFGRVTHQKGVDILFRAFAEFRTSHPTAALIVAGDGDEVPSLKQLAGELGITDAVRLLGAYTDVRAVAQPMDLVVMPSRWEGLPIAATEAAMLGLPLVCSDIGPMTELAERLAVPGWPCLVANGHQDPPAIASAMAEVAGSLNSFRSSAQAASDSATDLFSHQGTRRLIALYRELLDLRPSA